jgi:hypothetical protein
MNKYERVKQDLEEKGTGTMKCFGDSMLPIIKSGSKITFVKQDNYKVGDIVFCKVRGYWIDAHIIKAQHPTRGFMISNYDGWENGWTKTIYGRAVSAEHNGKTKEL